MRIQSLMLLTALTVSTLDAAPASKRLAIEAVRITINPTSGVVPAAITRPKGPFALIVVDQTRNSRLQLHLDDDKANRLKNVALSDYFGDWNEVLDLNPGIYVLSDAVNPKIRCVITITSK